MCESACPSGLPISGLFSSVGTDLQSMFGYAPGIDPAKEPPVKGFKEDEMHEESGSGREPPRPRISAAA